MRLYGAAMAVLLIAASVPAGAQLRDPLSDTVDPADRAVMAEAASAVSATQPELARLDRVLAKLPRPTPLRGMVQTVRAIALANTQRMGDAIAAVEEAMRLLPGDPRPKLAAFMVLTFGGAPQRAADLWIEASRESPELARASDRYILGALRGRLVEIGDRDRADRLGARLAELGYGNALAPERSGNALSRTRSQVSDGRTDLAAESVTGIGDPNDLLSLYIDRRFEALWPRIAAWAGPGLEDQSRRYLEELRGDWSAANTITTAVPYARRLASFEAYQAVVSLFLPMLDPDEAGQLPADAEFLAPVVASALVEVNRVADAKALLARVAAAIAKDDVSRELNVLSAAMRLDYERGDWAATLTQADALIGRLTHLGPAVNQSATTQIQAMRVCTLEKLHRAAEAQRAAAQVLSGEALQPDPILQIHICRGDLAAARALVIRRLDDDRTRAWGLRLVQPKTTGSAVGPQQKEWAAARAAIRAAPDVRAAAEKVGRILPAPVLWTLPAGFDPYRARPTGRPVGPDAI